MSIMYTKIILCVVFKMGAYHTLDLEVNRKFTLTKSEWDSVALERVDTACDPTQVCNIRLIREYCYTVTFELLDVKVNWRFYRTQMLPQW